MVEGPVPLLVTGPHGTRRDEDDRVRSVAPGPTHGRGRADVCPRVHGPDTGPRHRTDRSKEYTLTTRHPPWTHRPRVRPDREGCLTAGPRCRV